jgi:hypothetical protein
VKGTNWGMKIEADPERGTAGRGAVRMNDREERYTGISYLEISGCRTGEKRKRRTDDRGRGADARGARGDRWMR